MLTSLMGTHMMTPMHAHPLQVLQQGVEDPQESAAAVAAIHAALDGSDPPGPRPPRKRQKAEEAPGEPQVPTQPKQDLFPGHPPWAGCRRPSFAAMHADWTAGGRRPRREHVSRTAGGHRAGGGSARGC
jgi:hypothetical protein